MKRLIRSTRAPALNLSPDFTLQPRPRSSKEATSFSSTLLHGASRGDCSAPSLPSSETVFHTPMRGMAIHAELVVEIEKRGYRKAGSRVVRRNAIRLRRMSSSDTAVVSSLVEEQRVHYSRHSAIILDMALDDRQSTHPQLCPDRRLCG